MDHRSENATSTHGTIEPNPTWLHADADNADPARLLALVLIFYKDAMANQLSLTYLPNVFRDVQDHALGSGSLVQRHIPLGDPGSPEHESSQWARVLPDKDFTGSPASALVACLFYTIVNLQKSAILTFKQSLESNAKAVFNVVMASLMDGSQTRDCEDLLVLCMYLKMTDKSYPLRRCSSDICLEIIGESAFPIFARISIMKLILGPACFIMDDRKLTTKLANHITELLRQDSFEDIEFRALVNRIANKLGIIRILSEGDQQKIRMYKYLDLIAADPMRYTNPKKIVKFMPSQQWSRLMKQDLLLSFYETDHKHSTVLFLESCRIEGIQFTLLGPASLANAVLGLRDKEDEVMLALLLTQGELRPSGNLSGQTRRRLLEVALRTGEASGTVERHLKESSEFVCGALQVSGAERQLTDLADMLLQHSVVAPSKYVPKLAWWLTLCQRVCRDLNIPRYYAQVRATSATCLDAWLGLLAHRSRDSRAELESHLQLFSLLFPVHEVTTWTGTPNLSDSSVTPVATANFAPFLRELMRCLVPNLTRYLQDEERSVMAVLLAASTVFDTIAYKVPTAILCQESTAIRIVLGEIADMIQDSSLINKSLWSSIFPVEQTLHPFQVMQTRLDNLDSLHKKDPFGTHKPEWT